MAVPRHDNNIYFQLELIFPECRPKQHIYIYIEFEIRAKAEREEKEEEQKLEGKGFEAMEGREGARLRGGERKKKKRRKRKKKKTKTTEGRRVRAVYAFLRVSTSEEYDGGDVSLNI